MQGEVLEKINYSAVGETVYQTVLANGLRVFLLPKNDFNETYGIISTNFGSVDTGIVSRETKQVTQYPAGIAHFLEHKLFEGPQGKDLLLEFTKLGAESNAFTSFTRTSYLFSATDNMSENLQLCQNLCIGLISQKNPFCGNRILSAKKLKCIRIIQIIVSFLEPWPISILKHLWQKTLQERKSLSLRLPSKI